MTNLTKKLGIKYPIFNAGMAFVAGPELASAVTKSGGLGFLGAGVLPVAVLDEIFAKTVDILEDKPFGIDFITPFFTDEHIKLVLFYKPKVVVFFYGIPRKSWVDELKSHDINVWLTVNNVKEMSMAASLEPDAVIIQGIESGGHVRASITTTELFIKAEELLPSMSKIWAGGISSKASYLNALQRGAEGVWCGTLFLASKESDAHDEYKNAVVSAKIGDTTITSAFGPEWPNEPMRVFRNKAVQLLEEGQSQQCPEKIGVSYLGGQPVEMPAYSCILPMKDTEGMIDLMALTMGIVSSEIKSIRSVNEIISDIIY